jgi:predicted metal-dependent hydrolase
MILCLIKAGTDMNQLEVSDFSIDVIKKDIKNMHLSVYPPTGRVRLAVPLDVPEDAVRLFAISKLAWIKKHQRNFKAQDRQTPRKYVDRESHYFEGRRYLLRVTEYDGTPKVEVKTKTYIDLYVRTGSSKEQRQLILNKWYRENLKKRLPQLIAKWEKVMDVQVSDWNIKQMKTKWGSCNEHTGNILFNLELAKKPIHCLEFIVVHEMTHLLERKHNDIFHAYMDKFMPKWKQYRDELNRLPVAFEHK